MSGTPRRSARIRSRSQDSETESDSESEQPQHQIQEAKKPYNKSSSSSLLAGSKRKKRPPTPDSPDQEDSPQQEDPVLSDKESLVESDEESDPQPQRKKQRKQSTHAEEYTLSLDPGQLPTGTSLPSSSFLASLVSQRNNKTAQLQASLRTAHTLLNQQQDDLEEEQQDEMEQENVESKKGMAKSLGTSSTLKQLSLLRDQEQEQLMAQSVLQNIEKMHFGQMLDPYQAKRMQRQLGVDKERSKTVVETSGRGWFDMPATPLTPEIMQELKVLRMRGYLDPKRHYKSQDSKKIPKFFQMGTWVESKADFYSSRIPKKQRKARLVDELLDDAKFRSYAKKRFKKVSDKAQQYQKNKKKRNMGRGGRRHRR